MLIPISFLSEFCISRVKPESIISDDIARLTSGMNLFKKYDRLQLMQMRNENWTFNLAWNTP